MLALTARLALNFLAALENQISPSRMAPKQKKPNNLKLLEV
jgi:hypothetical protein